MLVVPVWIAVCVSVKYLRFWIIIDETPAVLKLGDIAVNLTELSYLQLGENIY